MKLWIYFSDSAQPQLFENIKDFFTEGGLLRVISDIDPDRWYPLTSIFKIEEAV